jgi:hypothetical protein
MEQRGKKRPLEGEVEDPRPTTRQRHIIQESISSSASSPEQHLANSRLTLANIRYFVEGESLASPSSPKNASWNWPTKPSIYSGSSGSSQGSSTSDVWDPRAGDVDSASQESIDRFRAAGKRYVEWIDNPTQPGCPVTESTLTFEQVLWARLKKDRYTAVVKKWAKAPDETIVDLEREGISTSDEFRDVFIRRHGRDWDNHRRFSEFGQKTREGIIIGEYIFRYHGYHWSEIALAQYRMDFDINTLRYVYFTQVINEETEPFVRKVLYGKDGFAIASPPRVWSYNTARYQEIMGTALGKAVACLVLAAWQRGTHQIERILTFLHRQELNLRFDIVQVTPDSPPGPTTSLPLWPAPSA